MYKYEFLKILLKKADKISHRKVQSGNFFTISQHFSDFSCYKNCICNTDKCAIAEPDQSF